MPRFWDRITSTVRAVGRAIRDPRSFAPPPLPTKPPEPAREPPPRPAPRHEREISRRPEPTRTRPIPRADLPAEWGPNKAALWQDATTHEPALARDENAQMFYDAALYTSAERREQAERNLANFKQYIRDEYGIEWDDVFDWASYREAYDTAVAQ